MTLRRAALRKHVEEKVAATNQLLAEAEAEWQKRGEKPAKTDRGARGIDALIARTTKRK